MLSTPISSHLDREPPKERLSDVYSAFYNAPVPMFVIDRDGTILDANPVFVAKYTQLHHRCIRANLFRDMASYPYTPPFSEKRIAMVKQVLNTGKYASVEDIVSGRCLLSGIYPVYSRDGNVEKCFIVTQDITSQKELEQRYKAQQSQWDITSQSCRLGLWRLNLETMLSDANAEFDRILGVEPYSMRWAPHAFIDRVVTEDRAQVESLIRNSIANHTDEQFECRIRRSDGDVRWISVLGKHQFDHDGKPVCITGVMQDITEQKELEINNRELQQQLLQSQKMSLLGQLAGGIAHDFNNVLAAIQGNAELILDTASQTDPHYQNLVTITESVKRSAEMVKQLLAFARKQPVCPKEIRLDNELEKMQLMFNQLIRTNISLKWELNCPQALVSLDPVNIVQIVTNIFVNACDAIGMNGCISLKTNIVETGSCCDELKSSVCCDSEEYACISISDTGSGIDPLVLPHIYEPFFTTKGIGKGTGLGLSTVYGLVKQNNGCIFCRTEIGRGTTFEIYFPIVKNINNPVETQMTEDLPETSGKATVLVVEDDPEIGRIIKLFLEYEGFNVLTVDNAEDAIITAESIQTGIDLVVSDIIMPGMNGIEMSRHLLQQNPHIRFLFVSGYSANNLEHFENFSEDLNFLSKPFSHNQFIHKVRDLLAK